MSTPKDPATLLLAIGQILVWAGLYYVFPALLLRWEQSLGWSKTDLTGAITVAILLSAVAAPLAGRIVDTGRGPALMLLSTLAGSGGLIGLSFATEIWSFYVSCAVVGLSMAGCLYEPCFALVTRARGNRARNTIILITLIAGFASSISFPVTHGLAEAYGWRSALRIIAIGVILLGAPILWLGAIRMQSENEQPASPSTSANGASDQHRWRFLRSAVFWLLAPAFAMMALVHGITLHHLLSLLDERGVDNEVAVIAAAFIGPMQVAGRLGLFAAGEHLSNHRLGVSCYIVMTLSVVVLFFAGASLSAIVLFVILFGAGYGLVSIARPVIARDLLGQQNFGSKSGTMALFYLAGSGTAPLVGSLIWSAGGYQLVLVVLFMIALIGLGLFLMAARIARRSSPA